MRGRSVQNARDYLSWLFPLLLVYCAVSISRASYFGLIVALIATWAVISGWMSFYLVQEEQYNDQYLITDIALLFCYFLLVDLSMKYQSDSMESDMRLWTISAATFAFYTFWNMNAWRDRDRSGGPSANETGDVLLKFAIWEAILCFVFVLCILSLSFPNALPQRGLLSHFDLQTIARIAGCTSWFIVLLLWQREKSRAIDGIGT